ncbi:MAG: hypothetical protein ABI430_01275 [Candidatus Taylorbacteria bacterium]
MSHVVVVLNSWSISIYADEGENVTVDVLKRIFEAARSCGFSAGSVGLYYTPEPDPKNPPAVPFVTVPHCEREDTVRILSTAVISSYEFHEWVWNDEIKDWQIIQRKPICRGEG